MTSRPSVPRLLAGDSGSWSLPRFRLAGSSSAWTCRRRFCRVCLTRRLRSWTARSSREVSFTVPPGSIPILQKVPGFEDFDGKFEVLKMLRLGFGLKDAPRAWNMMLVRTLAEIDIFPTCTDSQLFVKHVAGVLVTILSAHVDDLKGAGTDEEKAKLIKHLEDKFGKLKQETGNFEYVGIVHEQNSDRLRDHAPEGLLADAARHRSHQVQFHGNDEAAPQEA